MKLPWEQSVSESLRTCFICEGDQTISDVRKTGDVICFRITCDVCGRVSDMAANYDPRQKVEPS